MSNRNNDRTPLINLESGLMLPNGELASASKKIVGIKPVGSQVLVELLSYQEMHPSAIVTSGKFAKDEARHGWVRKIGPSVKKEDWIFAEGNRVLINGNGTPVPKFEGDNDREWVLLEPYTMKAILEESY